MPPSCRAASAGVDRDGVGALQRYEATRKARTAKDAGSPRANIWGKGVTDVDWVVRLQRLDAARCETTLAGFG